MWLWNVTLDHKTSLKMSIFRNKKNSSFEKMKLWYIYGKKFTKYLHGIWSLLKYPNDFCHKRKMDNFEPYNVLLAIATNIPVLLMTAFVLQGHICDQTWFWFLSAPGSFLQFWLGWSDEPCPSTDESDSLLDHEPSVWFQQDEDFMTH